MGGVAVSAGGSRMDRGKYFVRPFREEDYESWSRISRTVNPEFAFTAEEERHWERQFMVAPFINEKWIVEDRGSGEAVALASMSHSPFSFDPHKFWAFVAVDPEHRRRGLGQALSALLESEASAHHALCFWTNVRWDDPRSLEFARRLGFVELRRLWMSVLDLAQSGSATAPDRGAQLEHEGIRFTVLSAEGPTRPEVRHRLFELVDEAGRDVPRMGDYSPITFEQFEGELFGPTFLPDAIFLACEGETYVGVSTLERSLADPESLRVGFTGTRAKLRGRGIASELKRRALEYARAAGVRYLRTVNDSLNLRMWAINERQGFRRTIEWSAQERRFSPEAGTVPPAKAP